MADTPSAAPAAPAASNPAQTASEQVLNTLPKDQKTPVEARGNEVTEDTGDDLPPEEAKSKKAAEAAAKRAYKLKVGGKDLEVDEAELMKRAQMGYSADQKWQEAANMRRQMDAFIQLMQTDPAKALAQMGHDVDKLAEDRIRAKIEEMQKSPEQLEREKAQRELAELRAEREKEKTQTQEREKQRVQEQFAIEIENDISSALDNNEFGFPKTPYVVKRIADTMITFLSQALDPQSDLTPQQRDRLKKLSAKDVLPIVRDEMQAEQRELYLMTPDEVFEQLVGKDRLNKYRRNKIKKTASPKTSSANDVKSTGAKELQKAQDEADKSKKKVNAKDFFKTLGSR
jgi:hypothetical protein